MKRECGQKCPYEKHKLLSAEGHAVWDLLKLPGALHRVGMEASPVSFAWSDILAIADAQGLDRAVTVALLQLVENKMILALNSVGEFDEQFW